MRYLLATLAFSVSQCAGAVQTDSNSTFVRCGAEPPSLSWFNTTSSMANSTTRGASDAATESIAINLYMHVVTSDDEDDTVTSEMIEDQIDVLNQDYNEHGISFSLIDTSWTVNEDWAAGYDDVQMKAALRRGTYADLNLYLLSEFADTGLLGYCNFPTYISSSDDVVVKDGCIVAAGTLPGGDLDPYNEGGTSTHEVGHWFGLLHVFQGESCSGNGDYVSDTPQQKIATQGCPTSQDSCPDSAGLDDVHNPMDYSIDECYATFTNGQRTRMFQMWDQYRVSYKD